MPIFEFKRQAKDYIGLFAGALFLSVGLMIVLFSGGDLPGILFASVFLFLGSIAGYVVLKKWVTLKACKIMVDDSRIVIDYGKGRKEQYELSEIENARLDADGYLLFSCGGKKRISLPDILDLGEQKRFFELIEEAAGCAG